jgi:hypothetical protein
MEQGLLRNAPQEQCFNLANGRVLKNLHELANALVSMDEQTFSHHVNRDKNDFANWIQGVFKDEKLAKQISKIRNREGIRNRLNDALKEQAKSQQAQEPPRRILQNILAKRKKKAEEAQAVAPQPEVKPIAPSPEIVEMQRKLDEVLQREREIEFKERKLLEIDEKIEKKLLGEPLEHKFFSKEFVQGIVTGFLVTLILVLLYAKLVLQA